MDSYAIQGAAALAGENRTVLEEHKRIDNKCATFTNFAGVALAFLITQTGSGEPWPVKALLAASGLMFTAAVLVLLSKTLRPRLGSTGFCRWAQTSSQQITKTFSGGTVDDILSVERLAAENLRILSLLAVRRQRAMRHATDLLTGGVVLAALALVAGTAF